MGFTERIKKEFLLHNLNLGNAAVEMMGYARVTPDCTTKTKNKRHHGMNLYVFFLKKGIEGCVY